MCNIVYMFIIYTPISYIFSHTYIRTHVCGYRCVSLWVVTICFNEESVRVITSPSGKSLLERSFKRSVLTKNKKLKLLDS